MQRRMYRIAIVGLISLCTGIFPAAAQQLSLPALPPGVAAQFPAIGRIGNAGFATSQGCTATLIAPDLVLTAAHCAQEADNPNRVFSAGWVDGTFIASRVFKAEMRHPGYAPDGRHNPRNDVALVTLDSPITDVAPIPLGKVAEGALDGEQVALLGYHYRLPDRLSGDFSCSAIRFGVGLVHVGCPVINGNSGAPILGRNGQGEWHVVGVVSSRLGAGAVAVELPDWLRDEVAARTGR